MPKYRALHVKIIDSFDFNEMPSDFARVTWMLLTLVVDSEGRGIDNMAWLRSKIYPLRDDVTNNRMQAAFDWYANRGMVVRYSVAGKAYFYISTFKQYQPGIEREAKSVLPPPETLPSDSGETQEKVSAPASASVYESASDDAFVLLRGFIEKETGVPADGSNAVKAIDEMVSMGAMPEDVGAGIEWLKGQGKPIKYYASIVGPTRTAMQKRVQGGNGKLNGKVRLLTNARGETMEVPE